MHRAILTVDCSHIILALLSTGEAYIVDQRREHKGRVELCEVQEESDDESQMSKPRRVVCLFRDNEDLIHAQ
jgi:COMPASS component SWD1